MGKYLVKIFIACGSGIATSTLAADAVKKIADGQDIPVEIKKGTFGELSHLDDSYELILTTANYRKPVNRPHINVFSLVSGINADKTKEELITCLNQLFQR